MCTHAFNPEDFSGNYLLNYHGPGLYVEPHGLVFSVEKSMSPATKKKPKTSLLVKVICNCTTEDAFLGKFVHPFTEDTNYTRETMADEKRVLR